MEDILHNWPPVPSVRGIEHAQQIPSFQRTEVETRPNSFHLKVVSSAIRTGREHLFLIPVISSRAGGRKFQKKKETIGRSDALLIFAPHTRVLHLARQTKSTNQVGFEPIKIST